MNLDQLPIVATLSVEDNEKTIFDCLMKVKNNVDVILVIFQNSLDTSAYEVDKFIRRERHKNTFVFDLSSNDPWPDYKSENYLSNKSKLLFKNYNLAKSLVPNGFWIDVDPEVSLYDDARLVMKQRASRWIQPDISFEFFEIDGKNDCTIPMMHLSSKIFPGPETNNLNPIMYMSNKNQLLLVKSQEFTRTKLGFKI